jgi:hypothetical protein
MRAWWRDTPRQRFLRERWEVIVLAAALAFLLFALLK